MTELHHGSDLAEGPALFADGHAEGSQGADSSCNAKPAPVADTHEFSLDQLVTDVGESFSTSCLGSIQAAVRPVTKIGTVEL
jgi:prepilin-type processing-associated H-X9-DG protein